ncbi:uncharacterized protein N7483_002743 [Penicillium malachiteum]|uniref:uncharacterized protein n=1 Tax=Penicillium malachiteum TaxID=1324776 RepID=UPI002547DE54|nr:uncharacterized protein N7483_002743 [Penicillium malachiteum]KAJ5737618.1 hypothetical protein N7483_002743 [Penicillium malachiteum]
MGFISSLTRSICNNKLSRKLSTSKPHNPHYDDSKDLIKISSNTGSLTRVDSIASTIRLSNQEPITPTESPTHRKRLTPADLNLQTLFDNAEALNPATNHAVRAFTLPEYPVLQMDTVQSPSDYTERKLQDPIDTSDKWSGKKNMARRSKSVRVPVDRNKCGKSGMKSSGIIEPGSKIKRSMTGLLRRGSSLKIPRSSLSLKTLRGSTPVKDLDRVSLTEDNFSFDEKAELKWLELNGLNDRGLDFGIWHSNEFGHPWYY